MLPSAGGVCCTPASRETAVVHQQLLLNLLILPRKLKPAVVQA